MSAPVSRVIKAVLASAIFLSAAQHLAQATESPVAIAIQSQPLAAFEIFNPSRRRFGALEFRGGLVLRSDFNRFGGFSGIRIGEDGAHFIAVSDRGWWLRGRLLYDQDRPSGIGEAEMAPMLGADGRPLTARGWYDAESIAQDGGMLYVGFERVHQIVRFDYAQNGLMARGHPIAVPGAIRSLPRNKGLEALVFVPDGPALAGALIAVSERGLDKAGDIKAFLIGGPRPGGFAVKRTADYDVSDGVLLPPDDLLLLERKFNWTSGLAMRIRRIAVAAIVPGALVDGPSLMEADLRDEIDNMEGIGIHRGARAETVLTLISDDNFSLLQRTLLLQFRLVE